jgi:hypothetical protein
VITHPIRALTAAGDKTLDPSVEAHLWEICYELIVDYGVQNVLACLARAARVRASDFREANRRQYLRYQRAGSRILMVYEQVSEDAEQIDRIVMEEQRPVRVR